MSIKKYNLLVLLLTFVLAVALVAVERYFGYNFQQFFLGVLFGCLVERYLTKIEKK